jgi:MoaA/NifB/PqqE/SkfB family radical SAM enzyme
MLNFDSIENEMRYMKELGVDPSSFSEVIIAEENKIMTLKRSRQEEKCNRLWEIPYINVDGNLAICCFRPLTSDLNLGSLYTHSFESLWNSRKMIGLRSAVKKGICPYCVGCRYLG